MILQIKEPNDNFWLMAIGLAFILSLLMTLDSHAKPKPKNSFPVIIQSPANKMGINEGKYIKLKSVKSRLLADTCIYSHGKLIITLK